MNNSTTSTSSTVITAPYTTVDDGLISQILLFFIFAIVAAVAAKLIAVFASWCIKRQALEPSEEPESFDGNLPGVTIGVPPNNNLNTGLFAILPDVEKLVPLSTSTNNQSKLNQQTTSYNTFNESPNLVEEGISTSHPSLSTDQTQFFKSGIENPAFVQ